MPDPFKARPVSGEIMTGAVPASGRPVAPGQGAFRDIVEAEFETVRPDMPPSRFRNMPASIPKDTLTRGGLAFWIAGTILVSMAFLASGGYVLMGGNGSGLPTGDEQSDTIHTASVLPSKPGAEGHEGGEAPHFLGTREDRAKSQGSFVFSDRLGTPKDGKRSVSVFFSKEE